MRVLRESLALLAVLTVLCGIIYPLAVTGAARILFPDSSSGSLVRSGGAVVGSRLIGQEFRNPAFLWPRPSATPGGPYNAAASGGSNLGPLHPGLAAAVRERIERLRAQPGTNPAVPVPIDLVTASGSGLDPHESPAAAFYQAGRIAATRGVPEAAVREVIARRIEPRFLGVFGERRVSVLEVNLDLNARFGAPSATPANPPEARRSPASGAAPAAVPDGR